MRGFRGPGRLPAGLREAVEEVEEDAGKSDVDDEGVRVELDGASVSPVRGGRHSGHFLASGESSATSTNYRFSCK